MPGMDFKGNRHDQNRIQPGMQQLEVSLVTQGRYSFSIGDISRVIIKLRFAIHINFCGDVRLSQW